ncbi:C-GCAxxG-C-C family (seleno)protein [Acidaminococcus fermentans]|uniref:C-GCAxxG-C-C family (seleno)protein n=1 Tax=Acidaminococcus fermentans TaxID=905 RepID=UPI0015A0436A
MIKKKSCRWKGSYSCSQSVMCAFCDDAGISHAEAKYIAAPYAGGAKVKCGAGWGALLIFGKEIRKRKCREITGANVWANH